MLSTVHLYGMTMVKVSLTTTALMTWYLDQVQIDFPMMALNMQMEYEKCLEITFPSNAQIEPTLPNRPQMKN